MENSYTQIDINLIEDPEVPMRTDVTDMDIEELATSIRKVGLIEPIIVRDKGTTYEVIAGHRRLQACKRAELPVVPCVVKGGDEVDDDAIKLHENSFRADVNPVDEAYFIDAIMRKKECSVQDMAELMHRPASYVSGRLAILQLPEDIIEQLYAKKISLGVAHKLGRIEDDNSRTLFLTHAVNEGVSVRTADAWLRQWQAGRGPQQASDVVVEPLQGGGERRITYVPCSLCGTDAEIEQTDLIYVHRNCHTFLQSQVSAQNPPPTGDESQEEHERTTPTEESYE